MKMVDGSHTLEMLLICEGAGQEFNMVVYRWEKCLGEVSATIKRKEEDKEEDQQ
jgi:hypothetical protein